MKQSNSLSSLSIVAGFGMLIAFGIPMSGQEASRQTETSASGPNEVLRHNIEDWVHQRRGVPEDWSHHHLVFSNPGTEEETIANGTHDHWLSVVNDPRYILQQMKRSSGVKTLAEPETASLGPAAKTGSTKKAKIKIKKDWAENLVAGGQVQPNMYPAKFSFSSTVASCTSDFVVYPTGVAGASGAANVIAYNELYGTTTTGCSHNPVPAVYWAYNTGGMVTTSPVISYDGTGSQVAFIQVSGTTASLVILKWAQNSSQTPSSPGSLTVQSSASAYRSCIAPCFYSVSLGANDTYSAPFYDYGDDAIYVGDDTGRLHKITGVFNGISIAEASSWPVTLNGTYKTTSPVYDPTSGYVFVGNTGALLYAVGSGNAGTTNASIHGTSSDLGDVIIDAPLVDSSAEKVYAFVTTSGGNNAVYQFAANFTSGAGSFVTTGFGGTGYYFYSGNFDNVYYSSANGTAGDLWVLGNTGGSSGGGGGGVNLYRIPIGAGSAMSTPVAAISGLTSAPATITQDSVATAGSTGNASSLSWSHTVHAGSNVYLLVGLSYRVDNSGSGAGADTFASGIKANGTAMTCLIAISDNGTGSCGSGNSGTSPEPYLRGEIWYLSLGTIASTTTESIVATISVENSGNGTAVAGTSISYFGVSSVASGGDTDSNSVSATSASLAVTAALGTQLVVSNLALPKSSSGVSSQNSLLSDVSGSGSFASIQDGTSSAHGSNPTMGWTWAGSAPYSLTAAVLTPAAAPIYGWPSPITEFCNGGTSGCIASGTATTTGTDYLFLSIDRLASATGTSCGTGSGNGCVLSYSINTPTSAPTLTGGAAVTSVGTPGCWSASGIVVDNSVPSGTEVGASNIYLLALNGNGAGGPTKGTYTSSACVATGDDTNTPAAYQFSQSNP